METWKIVLIGLLPIFIIGTVIFIKTFKYVMDNPEKTKKMTDDVFDGVTKEKLKDMWKTAEMQATLEVEAEEAEKERRKREKRIEKELNKQAIKMRKNM